jgi:hypothetical protein
VFASGPTSPLTLSAVKKLSTTVCYLCGKPLVPPTNVDHPIMQQIFAPEIRRKHNISRLITFEVHQSCNTSYKRDEDYFVRALIPFARGSEAGNAIYAKALNDYRIGKQVPLTKKVSSEFDPNPSGLTLPGGKVVKRFDGERLARVAWKMVRGLHIHHTGEVLSERWPALGVQVFCPDQRPPDDVMAFVSYAKSRGVYPGVFDYKFEKFRESHDLHYWVLLLWDRIIFRVAFHDPACGCPTCEVDRKAFGAETFATTTDATTTAP